MKIVITGNKGRIGRLLTTRLNHNVTSYDLPEYNVADYEKLLETFKGNEAVIHLAWDTKTDNYSSDFHDPINAHMTFNVYRAAVEAGVSRVIMASSVHASMPRPHHTGPLVTPYELPYPDSPYGAGKVFVEALGRYYANYKNLEVVCIRFGGVGWGRQEISDPEHRFWLSDDDCVRLVERCLGSEKIDDNYAVINAVSDNEGRIHDFTNSIGWQPVEGIR